MQNEMTLCGILIGVMAFFMILGMVGIRREKRGQGADAREAEKNK